MAWTQPPRTWTAGETLTAGNLNTHLRDQLNWLANDHPRCQGNRSATQSIADSTDVAVAFTTTDTFDVGAMHDTAVNNTRFTVPAGGAGLYTAKAWGQWTAAAAGIRALYLRKNGSEVYWRVRQINAGSGAAIFQEIGGDTQLSAGDYVELIANQNSGGALNIEDVHLVIRWVAF